MDVLRGYKPVWLSVNIPAMSNGVNDYGLFIVKRPPKLRDILQREVYRNHQYLLSALRLELHPSLKQANGCVQQCAWRQIFPNYSVHEKPRVIYGSDTKPLPQTKSFHHIIELFAAFAGSHGLFLA